MPTSDRSRICKTLLQLRPVYWSFMSQDENYPSQTCWDITSTHTVALSIQETKITGQHRTDRKQIKQPVPGLVAGPNQGECKQRPQSMASMAWLKYWFIYHIYIYGFYDISCVYPKNIKRCQQILEKRRQACPLNLVQQRPSWWLKQPI